MKNYTTLQSSSMNNRVLPFGTDATQVQY